MNGEPPRSTWFGWTSLAVAIMLVILVFFELRDGELLGSRSNGITAIQNPIVFYICIVMQIFIVVICSISAYSILKRK